MPNISMKSTLRILALLAGFLLGQGLLYGQSGGVSPYSIYGHGWVQPNAFAYHNILGGTQAAATSGLYVNPAQPASYADLRYTTLDLGGSYMGIHQANEQASLWNTTGGFKNMGVAFPLKKWMGFSSGLMPYSLTGYDMLTQGVDPNFGEYTQQFKGSGGYTKLHAGIGLKPWEFLALGFNANYLFGSLDQKTSMIFNNNQFNSVRMSERTLASDWYWDAGAQLRIPIGSVKAVLGATIRNGSVIASTYNNLSYTYISNGAGSETPLDTGSAILSQEGYIYLPAQMSIGLELNKPAKDLPVSAWSVGVQYQVTETQFLLPFSTGTLPWLTSDPWSGPFLENSHRISASGSVIPSLAFPEKRLKGFKNDIAYRAAFSYENTGLVLNQTPIHAWQASLGMGLPIGGRAILPGDVKFATLHIGAQIGSWGTKTNGLIQEFYTQATVGVTLNDQWFVKFKYR
jgi:hypothetical protein